MSIGTSEVPSSTNNNLVDIFRFIATPFQEILSPGYRADACLRAISSIGLAVLEPQWEMETTRGEGAVKNEEIG